MELLLAALIHYGIQAYDAAKEKQFLIEQTDKCRMEGTCRIVEQDHGYAIEYIKDAKPDTEKYRCVRERTCDILWTEEGVKFVPKVVVNE